jgi:hypothetical protein
MALSLGGRIYAVVALHRHHKVMENGGIDESLHVDCIKDLTEIPLEDAAHLKQHSAYLPLLSIGIGTVS